MSNKIQILEEEMDDRYALKHGTIRNIKNSSKKNIDNLLKIDGNCILTNSHNLKNRNVNTIFEKFSGQSDISEEETFILIDNDDNIYFNKKSLGVQTIKPSHLTVEKFSGQCDISEDETFILIDNDDNIYFNKKSLGVQTVKPSHLTMENFPNVLLINNDDIKKSGTLFENTSDDMNINDSDIDVNIILKKENVWDILNQIRSETVSDTKSINNNTDDNKTQFMSRICKGCSERDSFSEDISMSIIVCTNCGTVCEEILDHNPEWRQYNNDDSRNDNVNRCGCPSNFFFPQSSQGTIMSRCGNSRLKRKQKWNSTVYKERSLTKEFDYITQICVSNNIKKCIIDTAKIMYKKISDCKHKSGKNMGGTIIIRGENRISIMAICVSKSCESNKEPRSNEEIAKMFGLDETKITKGNNIFEKIKKNCMDRDLCIFEQLHTSTPEDYVRYHCKNLRISITDTEMAVRISNNCCKIKLATDHNAQSVAAGSILAMVDYCNLDIDKKAIAKLSKTSDVTITKIYGKIVPYIEALVDNDATDHIIKKFKING